MPVVFGNSGKASGSAVFACSTVQMVATRARNLPQIYVRRLKSSRRFHEVLSLEFTFSDSTVHQLKYDGFQLLDSL
jgi:hypothetical protein